MNTFWFGVIILAFIWLQNMLYKKFIFKEVAIERSFDTTGVFPEESFDFSFSVANRKFLPITWLSLEQRIPTPLVFEGETNTMKLTEGSYSHISTLYFLPFQKVHRSYRIKCTKRGYYELRDIHMYATNLFGTEKYDQPLFEPVGLVVYPNIVNLDGAFIKPDTTLGDFSVNRWIIDDPMMIVGIRPYLPTDSLKSINWKATAKGQKLLVNKYDYTSDKKVMIVYNLDEYEYRLQVPDIEAIESSIEVGASLAVSLIRSGTPVGLATNVLCLGRTEDNLLKPSTGEKHVVNMLRMFACFSYSKRFPCRELFSNYKKELSWNTDIVVVTPSISDELVAELKEIKSKNISLICTKKTVVTNLPKNVSLYIYNKEGENYAVQ